MKPMLQFKKREGVSGFLISAIIIVSGFLIRRYLYGKAKQGVVRLIKGEPLF